MLVIWLSVASLLLNLALATGLWALWRKAHAEADQAHHKMRHLEQQISIATSGAIGMGHRIVALEQKLQSLQDKQENLGGMDVFAYSQALQMFEQGADVATVASNCGFSSSEAQLMALVQQQIKNPAVKSGAKPTAAPIEAGASGKRNPALKANGPAVKKAVPFHHE